MASKPTPNKTKPKTTKKAQQTKADEPSFMQIILGNFYSTFRSQKLWVSVGVIICTFSVLLAASFISNIFSGYAD